MPPQAPATGGTGSSPLTLRDYIHQTADALQIPRELALAIAEQESGGTHQTAAGPTTSPKGAVGFYQLMPETAKQLGVDPTDPIGNIVGGLRYFKQQLDAQKGDVRLALAAYNAGPGRVTGGQVPDIPETQEYVQRILQRWQAGGNGAAAPAGGGAKGLLVPGTIDLRAQPQVKNANGTTSTVDSSSYNIDGQEVLLPSVTPTGQHLRTPAEIVAEYRRTGRHLGIFDSPESATAYAQQLHADYAAGQYGGPKTATLPPAAATRGMLPPETATRTPRPHEPTLIESTLVDPIRGFGKAASKTVGDVGRLVEKTGVNLPDIPLGDTTPRTAGESVGAFAEQAAEFALPAEKIAQSRKALQITAKLVQAGITPARARVVASIAEGGAQAAAAAGISLLHGDDPTTPAVIAAASPIASTLITQMAPAIRATAKAKMARFFEKGVSGDITPELQKSLVQAAGDFIELPLQRTWRQTAALTRKVRGEAGKTLGAALEGPLGDTPVGKQPVIDALDDFVRETAQHLTPVGTTGELRTVTFRPDVTRGVEDLKDLLNQYGETIPARQLHDIKKTWQQAIYPRREAAQPVSAVRELLTSGQKEARLRGAAAISKVLETDAPQVAALDDAVSHAIKLDQFTKRLAVKARAGLLASAPARYAIRSVAGAAGLATGGLTGHPFVGANLGYGAGGLLVRAIEAPTWRLLPIAGRRRLADAIATGNVETVRKIVTPIVLAATAGQDDLLSPSNAASSASASR